MLWRKKDRQAIETLRQATSAARLSDLEKQTARDSLARFMQAHPVREAAPVRQLGQIRGREIFSAFFLTRKYMFATMAIILVLALGGGVTYAAEGALPGEALYPIKVKVTEEVRAAFATSAEADANWDVRRAERRLEEAAALAANGRLDSEKRLHLEERFEAHAERVQARVEKLEAAGKEEQAERVSDRLAVSLRVHERILDEIAEAAVAADKVEIEVEVKPLVRKIRVERKANDEAHAAAEARIEARVAREESDDDEDDEDDVRATATVMIKTETAAAGRREAAKNKIAEAERFIARADLPAEAMAKAEAQLNEAKTLLVTGEVELTAKEFDAAFALFGHAQRAAQEAKVSAQAHARLRAHLPAGFKIEIELEDDGATASTGSLKIDDEDNGDEDDKSDNGDRGDNRGREKLRERPRF